jgi:hypothetical protein
MSLVSFKLPSKSHSIKPHYLQSLNTAIRSADRNADLLAILLLVFARDGCQITYSTDQKPLLSLIHSRILCRYWPQFRTEHCNGSMWWRQNLYKQPGQRGPGLSTKGHCTVSMPLAKLPYNSSPRSDFVIFLPLVYLTVTLKVKISMPFLTFC